MFVDVVLKTPTDHLMYAFEYMVWVELLKQTGLDWNTSYQPQLPEGIMTLSYYLVGHIPGQPVPYMLMNAHILDLMKELEIQGNLIFLVEWFVEEKVMPDFRRIPGHQKILAARKNLKGL